MSAHDPFACQLRPLATGSGPAWVVLHVTNTGDQQHRHMDLRLQTRDHSAIRILDPRVRTPVFVPGQEMEVSFPIIAHRSGRVILSVDSVADGNPQHWESPAMRIQVREDHTGPVEARPPQPAELA